MKKHILALSILAMFMMNLVWAQDADVEKALRMTQEMLKDPKAREATMNATPQGKAAGNKVKNMAGSEANEQAIYELAADVFANLVKQTNGDPEKMQKLLEEGMKNPESFANQWSPEELQQLQKISAATPTGSAEMSSYKSDTSTKSDSSKPHIGPAKVRERPISAPTKK